MILYILFFLSILFYSFFSYSLVDPNLVLSSNATYWSFQNWMWSTFFENGKLMAYTYFFLITTLFIIYFNILEKLRTNKTVIKNIFKNKYIFLFLIIILPLLFSYNALSHDVFNYIFNSRMIVEYGADPYVSVALDFPDDLWTRFMHNTHTPAPYGKGWTYLSLVPYLLGFGKFTLSLLSFRVWSLLSVFLLYFSLQHLSKSLLKRSLNLYELGLVFFNPLLLIETISNYHNDLWMMVPAVFGVSFLVRSMGKKGSDNKDKMRLLIISIFLLIISISIKLASLALIPIWLLAIGLDNISERFSQKLAVKFKLKSEMFKNIFEKFITSFWNKFQNYIPDFAALLMLLPLFTARSQQFLPWYVLWVFVWIPFIKIKLFRNLIIIFTISSSLRYLPWLANNMDFSSQIITNQKYITWLIPTVFLFTNLRKLKR
jgi:hypothetical protein